jgi:D-tyrosyl-tRNA(Tyr) deacylase
MRVVLQRVSEAAVEVEGTLVGSIGKGLLVLLGVADGDGEEEAQKLAAKCCKLRIFEDDEGKMNCSLLDINGEMLIVSQFTLLADCQKGLRPSWHQAAKPETAQKLYQLFIDEVRRYNIPVACGRFGAMMQVHLSNDGPVTILLDT